MTTSSPAADEGAPQPPKSQPPNSQPPNPRNAGASAVLGQRLILALSVLLCVFTVAEVNYPHLTPHGQLAIFTGIGLVLCFLRVPASKKLAQKDGPAARLLRWLDRFLAAASAVVCGYVVVQSEPLFQSLWSGGIDLGNRAGLETSLDYAVGAAGLVLVLEATRRTIGIALPILALLFLAYAILGPDLPSWLFPHRGYEPGRIVAQTFLHSQGVFGTALRVMFTYVFLFVLFGALLEITGAIAFFLRFPRRVFRHSPGGAAKVAVLSSGLMGSLSGSAVANTATTGTFTIPMMRSSGLKPHVAGGVEAAASSGGALVPPVMGAGAYMMLEIVTPPVTYLEIIRAALIPAVLYYLSLFLIVHFRSRRVGERADSEVDLPSAPAFGGVVFGGAFLALIAFLLLGYTPFRAVTLALVAIVALALCHASTRLRPGDLVAALGKTARDMLPLIAAAACVGIILGVVTLTGVGTRLPAAILPLAQESLLLALGAIMISSIVLGMGLPSAVCYLLLATLIGPVLGRLGVVPLAAHLFIFYFGMMSMVTPPVALAGYTAASIAGSGILRTSFAAFRFALVGFTLPYMFVLRPQLLMLEPSGGSASVWTIAPAVLIAVLGILPFAAGIAGHFLHRLSAVQRGLLLVASALLLIPGPEFTLAGIAVPTLAILGLVLLILVTTWNWRQSRADGSYDRG